MNIKQYQFLNENRVPKNSMELFYSRLFEKYKQKSKAKNPGAKQKYKRWNILVEWNQGSEVATYFEAKSIKQPQMLFTDRRLLFYFIVRGEAWHFV